MILCCREKPLASSERPVPQTNSGGQVENTKAIERTVVKELGKCPRNFGRRGTLRRQTPCVWQRWGVAETSEKRLFTKNTGPCQVVRRCIRTDACPVLER